MRAGHPSFAWGFAAVFAALPSMSHFWAERTFTWHPAPHPTPPRPPSHSPARGWGAGRRAYLSSLGASGDSHRWNQRHVPRMTLTETTASLSPKHLTSQKKTRAAWGPGVIPLRAPCPNSSLHVGTPLQQSRQGQASKGSPDLRPPPSEGDSQGPRRDKSVGRAHSPAQRRRPRGGGTALGGSAPEEGAQHRSRARPAASCRPGGAGKR